MVLDSLRSDWRETDKVLVIVELGIIVSALFMGFQFMEYHSALEDEGCRYYYENYVDGYEGGEFLNRTEYKEFQSTGFRHGFPDAR